MYCKLSMKNPEGIEVYTKSVGTGTRYEEHLKPGGRDDNKSMERYIQAISNDQSAVVVEIRRKFKYFNATHLKVAVEFDGLRSDCTIDSKPSPRTITQVHDRTTFT